MSTLRRFPGSSASWLVRRLWQDRAGPLYNTRTNTVCRFYPSCSAYASEAFLRYGFLRGLWRSLSRVRRCSPSNTDSCIDLP